MIILDFNKVFAKVALKGLINKANHLCIGPKGKDTEHS